MQFFEISLRDIPRVRTISLTLTKLLKVTFCKKRSPYKIKGVEIYFKGANFSIPLPVIPPFSSTSPVTLTFAAVIEPFITVSSVPFNGKKNSSVRCNSFTVAFLICTICRVLFVAMSNGIVAFITCKLAKICVPKIHASEIRYSVKIF